MNRLMLCVGLGLALLVGELARKEAALDEADRSRDTHYLVRQKDR